MSSIGSRKKQNTILCFPKKNKKKNRKTWEALTLTFYLKIKTRPIKDPALQDIKRSPAALPRKASLNRPKELKKENGQLLFLAAVQVILRTNRKR